MFSLAKGIRRITSASARVIGHKDRGVLKKGFRAEVNVFDPSSVAELQPKLVHDFPFGTPRYIQKSRGYKATIVNGEINIEDGEHTGARAGTAIRHGVWSRSKSGRPAVGPEARYEDRQSCRLPSVLSDSQGPPSPGGPGKVVKRDAVLVKVETESGLVGWGESHAGRAPGAVALLANTTLKELILGMDASDVVGAWDRIYKVQLTTHRTGAACAMAMSGIDLALWDIRAQAAGWPLYKLLGGRARPTRAYTGGVSLATSPSDPWSRKPTRWPRAATRR